MVQDLQAVNSAVIQRAPCVPDPHTLLNSLTPDAKIFSVIDISNAFFSVPVAEESQFWFAFTYAGSRYTFTRLPQGYCESPTIYSQVPGYWPPGSSEEAVFFAKRITLKNQGSSLLLTVTLPDDTVRPPHATLLNTSCWGFQLWAWSSGKDPQFPIVLCVNKTMRGADSPVLSDFSKTSGAVITSVALTDVDSHFVASTGMSGQTNNWLLMAEQAANVTNTSCVVCMGPRPLLRIIPASVAPECAIFVMSTPSIPSAHPCSSWDKVYPVSSLAKSKPLFSTDVAKGNFTCIKLPGTGASLGVLSAPLCTSLFYGAAFFSPIARSDIWFWCNTDTLYDSLPFNSSGTCALVTLLLPVLLMPASTHELDVFIDSFVPRPWSRAKRSAEWQGAADPTYIDAIGVPRGVPDEYKLVIFSAVLTLCGCCCIPCLRSLINKLITTAISPPADAFPLLPEDDFELPRPPSCHLRIDSIDEAPAVDLSDLFPESDVV
ncbi:uncharacterized protein LOC133156891 isoform X2 [Syngnathus typhle]|uniref:uncharacterized protein LOC133156891 isoform X2 n=1 Tax=Syngnathus typhle TaxID=161592 RepID=UPI002A69DF21|nr:uncharacterized protein LOC133156891 isoform X2 [Syngnathus typhle]